MDAMGQLEKPRRLKRLTRDLHSTQFYSFTVGGIRGWEIAFILLDACIRRRGKTTVKWRAVMQRCWPELTLMPIMKRVSCLPAEEEEEEV
jgi:hypothetical protein